MMIGLFLLLQAATTAAPPTDWSALPALRLNAAPDYPAIMTRFVHDEVVAGRCTAPATADGKISVKLDMIVLVSSANGEALRIVPKAINCPTVEQFAAGVVQKAMRGNIAGPPPTSDMWYRTGMTITWGQ